MTPTTELEKLENQQGERPGKIPYRCHGNGYRRGSAIRQR